MKNSLMEEIKKILEIVNICPTENLKEICFKALLEDILERKGEGRIEKKQAVNTEISEEMEKIVPEINKRIRTLGTTTGIAPRGLLRIFLVEEDVVDISSMIDLGSVKAAAKQRKLALLIAASNFLGSGDYKIPIEELRQKCVDFSTYDAPNFTKNLKGMGNLLLGKFNLKQDQKLSADGKKEVVKLLKELIKEE